MGTGIAAKEDYFIADEAATVPPAGGWLVVGVEVEVNFVPRVLFHVIFLKVILLISNGKYVIIFYLDIP